MAPLNFEIPRPQKFLYLMSLRTGAELITTSLLINKVSGVYGILALFTGYELSATQLSMYVYSILALLLALLLFPGIRTGDPLRCLALAHLYALDSAVNALYTLAFAFSWFAVLAGSNGQNPAASIPGGKMMNDTAGFTSPDFPADSVDVHPSPQPGLTGGESAVGVGLKHPDTTTSTPEGLSAAVLNSAGLMSVTALAALWAARAYFVLVMLAFARRTLRRHIASTAHSSSATHWGPAAPAPPAAPPTGTTTTTNTTGGTGTAPAPGAALADDPFGPTHPEGRGWQGRLGRSLLRVGRTYWLGPDEEGEWVRGLGGKFAKRGHLEPPAERAGVHERERRRRSGTGPSAGHPPAVGGLPAGGGAV